MDRVAERAEVPADLRCEGMLGRFPAETEKQYRTWLLDRQVKLFRAVSVFSLISWIAIPIAASRALDGTAIAVLWWVSYGFNIPVILVGLAIAFTSRLNRFVVPAGAFVLVVVGGGIILFTQFFMEGKNGLATTAIWFTFVAAFLHLPARATAVVVVVLDGAALFFVVSNVIGGRTSFNDAWVDILYLILGIPIAIGMALVLEIIVRRAFVGDQVTARQQAQLLESQRLIRRYVPAAVADRIESGEGAEVDVPQRRRVTILFSDVVGFTDLADQLDPESLTQIINEYLAAMAEIVEANGGTLNEFAGDGFMAVFGAPTEMAPEQQVHAAVAAAHQIHGRLPMLNEGWFRLGIDEPLRTRIGINTGVLSVGTFGSAGRATYTAIGLQTNIAARIQAHSEPGGTLLSHSSWQLVKDQDPCEPRGEVTVKGVHFPIKVYAPQPQDV